MIAPLSFNERAELERLRRLTRDQAEELRAWREFDEIDGSAKFLGWAGGLGLSPSQARIVQTLLRVPGEAVRNDFLLQALEPYRRDQSADHDPNIVKVHVNKIRARLNARGICAAIRTHVGFGYSLSLEAAAFLRPQAQGRAA